MKIALTVALVLAAGCKGSEEKTEKAKAKPSTVEDDAPIGIVEPTPPPPRPASVTDQHMALVDRVGAVANEAARIAGAHTGDCDASAAALSALTARSAADVKGA